MIQLVHMEAEGLKLLEERARRMPMSALLFAIKDIEEGILPAMTLDDEDGGKRQARLMVEHRILYAERNFRRAAFKNAGGKR